MYFASFKYKILPQSGNFSNFERVHRVAKCTKIDSDFRGRDGGGVATPIQNLGMIGPLSGEISPSCTEEKEKK